MYHTSLLSVEVTVLSKTYLIPFSCCYTHWSNVIFVLVWAEAEIGSNNFLQKISLAGIVTIGH